MEPRILVVDDDPSMVQAYRDILEDHGFTLTAVHTREAALEILGREGPWDVVLLDEKLMGAGGPATAASTLLDIAALSPTARTVVITGFATPDLVRDAIQAGAWDYLEKDAPFVKLLLPLRVRHAVEAARERRLGLDPHELEGELRRQWASVQSGRGTWQERGRWLEETICLLFRTIAGLEDARVNVRTGSEEFDVVVLNASRHPVLQKEGAIFLVECKNWSGKVGPKDLDYLRTKLGDRHGRATLGLLIGVGGFTAGVDEKLARSSNHAQLVVPIDGAALDAWINASDRTEWLVQRVRAAALRV